jgi:hypothetical protein
MRLHVYHSGWNVAHRILDNKVRTPIERLQRGLTDPYFAVRISRTVLTNNQRELTKSVMMLDKRERLMTLRAILERLHSP